MSYDINPHTGQLENVGGLSLCDTMEQYIPFMDGLTKDSVGIKGQWSFDASEGNFWICVASNSWLQLYGKDAIDRIGFIKLSDTINDFVPPSFVTSSNSIGIKGQWTFKSPYYYQAIGTNTWIRYAVATSF